MNGMSVCDGYASSLITDAVVLWTGYEHHANAVHFALDHMHEVVKRSGRWFGCVHDMSISNVDGEGRWHEVIPKHQSTLERSTNESEFKTN